MSELPTHYDEVAYPSGTFFATAPEHMAALARMHGLTAPAPETARVLEIAGGDGANLIAMAAAWPHAQFHVFDLATTAIANGVKLAAEAGLDNIRITVDDVLRAAETLDGPFDYIIAHGLYAWVPEPVREATLRLIGKALSPDGIAFLSYNANPGGHMRTAIREMLLHRLCGIVEPAKRIAAAREVLGDFAIARENDPPVLAGMREVAAPMLDKSDAVLFHDELGEVYAPQSLCDVVAAAERHGLAFLNDANPSMVHDGLPGDNVAEQDVVAIAQADDYAVLAFFHQTLLIRPGREPRRGVGAGALAGIYASTRVKRTGPGAFALDGQDVEMDDDNMAELLGHLVDIAPQRLLLDEIDLSVDNCVAIVQLYQRGVIWLYAVQSACCLEPGEFVRASRLARTQLARGLATVHTLELRSIGFVEPGPRAFVALLDGTRDRAALARDWANSGHGDEVTVDIALAQLASAGMISG